MLQNFTRLLFLLIIIPIFGQLETAYNLFEERYAHYKEGDSRAIPLIKESIEKAIDLNDNIHLFYANQDGVYFSEKTADKLKYADASIKVASQITQKDLIATAFLSKGVVLKKREQNYSSALKYLKMADSLLSDGKNLELKYQVKYHIGKLKSQLFQYEEALKLFSETENYFRGEINRNLPDQNFENSIRGLINSLNQKALCNIMLSEFQKASKIINEGIALASGNLNFAFEKDELQLTKGILHYHTGDYKEASNYFHGIQKRNVLTNYDHSITLLHFYLGKTYSKLGIDALAYQNFKKLDSLHEEKGFISNEIRSAYQYLLKAPEVSSNKKEGVRIMKALEKIESKLSRELINLNSESYRSSNQYYLSSSSFNIVQRWKILLLLILGIGVLYLFELSRIERVIFQPCAIQANNFLKDQDYKVGAEPILKEREPKYNEKAINDVKKKLDGFKKSNGFLKKGITIEKLAKKFGTNRTFLSYVLNSVLGLSFIDYINRLRVEYIIAKVKAEPKYLLYTIEALGEEAGFASRQSFSDQFKNVTGTRPTDYFKALKIQMENNQ